MKDADPDKDERLSTASTDSVTDSNRSSISEPGKETHRSAYSEPRKETLGFFDRQIDRMNRFELNVTANPYVEAARGMLDKARMYLQKDTTGGEGKQRAELSEAFSKGKLADKVGEIAVKAAKQTQKPFLQRSAEALGAGVKQFGKSAAGFAITLGVQVGNCGIKTGAVLFNTGKLAVMAFGTASAAITGTKSELCTAKNLRTEAANLRYDIKSTVISYMNTFALATGVGALMGAKAGAAYSASQATTGLADKMGKAMGFTAAQVEEAALGKKAAATIGELNKTETYKKTVSIMEKRDPEMYKKLVELRAKHIDREGATIEERRAAAVVEKEILETFRNNQNTMVGMTTRVAKKAYALATGKDAETTAHEDWGVKVEVKKDSIANTAFHTVTFGAFKAFDDRQKEGHAKIEKHKEHLDKYLGMRAKLSRHDNLSAVERHELNNLHREFGKKSFSREM